MAKVSRLSRANDMLDEKYGKFGTKSRAEFNYKAKKYIVCNQGVINLNYKNYGIY